MASQGAQVVRYDPLAFGSRFYATDLRTLRFQSPTIEEVAAEAEFLCDLRDRFAGCQQFNSLCFEL